MSPMTDIAAALLTAGLFLGGAGLGAAMLRLIGQLTGGTWSEAPAIPALAASAPPLLILIFAARMALCLWLPGAGYTAVGWMALRLLIACAAWVVVAWLGARRRGQAISAASLLVLGVLLPLMGYDLITSLEPGWASSAEAYALAVRMIGAALSVTLVIAPPEGRDRRDLQGLLVATLLATLYLNLMSYLVPWYGDLPDKVGWIRLRQGPVWEGLIAASLGLGAVLPLPLLALRRRLGETAERWAAGLALTGFFGQTLWLVAPPFSPFAVIGAAGLAGLGVIAVWTRLTGVRRLAHG